MTTSTQVIGRAVKEQGSKVSGGQGDFRHWDSAGRDEVLSPGLFGHSLTPTTRQGPMFIGSSLWVAQKGQK
jgi:hypothetical protein